ncbi:unnamed protein product [Meloidogyne enterolobii]|uniref:Uncharacterized protein n=1 Tax=Meloidogyne enterolobii TaxID=390850 RepID=A0ACB0ZG12_MELEN
MQTSYSHLYPGGHLLYLSQEVGFGVVDGVSGRVGGATHVSPKHLHGFGHLFSQVIGVGVVDGVSGIVGGATHMPP